MGLKKPNLFTTSKLFNEEDGESIEGKGQIHDQIFFFFFLRVRKCILLQILECEATNGYGSDNVDGREKWVSVLK